MSKVITYQEGNELAVVRPSTRIPIEEVAKMVVPQGVSFAIIDADQLPDEYFRNAWEYDGPTGAKVNVEKAKEIQRNVWRKIREPKLAQLDIELMKALETGSTPKRKEVADRKQALRDVTSHPLPDDLAAIKATIPEVLI